METCSQTQIILIICLPVLSHSSGMAQCYSHLIHIFQTLKSNTKRAKAIIYVYTMIQLRSMIVCVIYRYVQRNDSENNILRVI